MSPEIGAGIGAPIEIASPRRPLRPAMERAVVRQATPLRPAMEREAVRQPAAGQV
jgi:hypothetical protein